MHLDTAVRSRVGLQKKLGLQTFDKLIVLIVLALAVAASGISVSRYVVAAELNYQKQELQSQILTYKEANTQIEMKIAELSSPERIYEIAINDIGMQSAPAQKVKIVQRAQVAEVGASYEGEYKQ